MAMSRAAKDAKNAYQRRYYRDHLEQQRAYHREYVRAHKDAERRRTERYWERIAQKESAAKQGNEEAEDAGEKEAV